MPTTAIASVCIDVPPDDAWQRSALALGSAAGLALAAWASAWLSWPAWAAVATMGTLATAGAVLGVHALRAPVGTLRRHGDAWWWHRDGEAGTSAESGMCGDVIVTIDFGRWMLVRFEPLESRDRVRGHASSPWRRPRPLWLPMSAAAGGSAWPAWRALLLSRRATLPERLRQPAARADR